MGLGVAEFNRASPVRKCRAVNELFPYTRAALLISKHSLPPTAAHEGNFARAIREFSHKAIFDLVDKLSTILCRGFDDEVVVE